MKIYHNPQCSKSNAALELIQQHGIIPEVVEYLHTVPTKDELIAILGLLQIRPLELIRTKELLFQEKFEGNSYTDEQCMDIMLQYPELIERPIVINGDKAVIGRPVERILELF